MFYIEPKMLTPQNFEEFLSSGIVFPGEGEQLLIGWPLFRSSGPIPGGLRFFASNFYLESKEPYGHCGHWAQIEKSALREGLKNLSKSKIRNWIDPEPEDWSKKFNRIALEFRTARLRKAVPTLTIKSHGPIEPPERAAMLLSALDSKTQGYLYGFWQKDSGVLGLTPELLYSQVGKELSTMALAATATNPDELRSEKNQIEHSYVVEDLIARLSAFGDIHKYDQEVISFGTLFHLRTRIDCALKEQMLMAQWTEVLHPTSALGTSPMAAWKTLKGIDDNPYREFLGAPIGLEDTSGNSKVLVGIRNVQWSDREAWMTAGCGVVAQSVESDEWNEIVSKMKNVKRIFFS